MNSLLNPLGWLLWLPFFPYHGLLDPGKEGDTRSLGIPGLSDASRMRYLNPLCVLRKRESRSEGINMNISGV